MGRPSGGFASILEHEITNLDFAAQQFLAINMGATAIGTGICSEPEYADYCTEALAKITGWDITRTPDFVGATSDTGEMIGYELCTEAYRCQGKQDLQRPAPPLQWPSLRTR